MTIQDVINKARENASFNQTMSGTIQNSIITPKPLKNKTKLVLKRHKSNFSLGRPSNNLPSTIQNLAETNSQVSSAVSLKGGLNPNHTKNDSVRLSFKISFPQNYVLEIAMEFDLE